MSRSTFLRIYYVCTSPINLFGYVVFGAIGGFIEWLRATKAALTDPLAFDEARRDPEMESLILWFENGCPKV